MNTISFHLEKDSHEEVNFKGATLTFTLRKIEIWTNELVFKNIILIVNALVENTTVVQKTLLLR